ncbi:MAG: hypothetical protein DRP57_12190, partial [Spirochaetes bacterium]
LKSSEYENNYKSYVNNFKNAVWFDKILSLTAEQTAKQTAEVKAAKEAYNDNLDEILSAGAGIDLEEIDLEAPGKEYDFPDFYRLKTGSGGLDKFEIASALRGEPSGTHVIRLKTGIDSNGKQTKVFADNNVRDMYFYMGGTVEALTKKHGFTINKAEKAFKNYGVSSPTYSNDRKKWVKNMAGFLKGKSAGDAALVFKNWSLAYWYYMYSTSGQYGKNSTEETIKNFWEDKHKGLEPSAVIGSQAATVKHVLGKGWEDQLKSTGQAAYKKVTGNRKENELFRFYAFSEDMGLDLQRSLINNYFEVNFKKNVLDRMDAIRVSHERAGSRLMQIYACMVAAAAAAAFIPFIGQVLSVAIIVNALAVFGNGMIESIAAALTKKNIKDVLSGWGEAAPDKLGANYFNSVQSLASGINRNSGLAKKLTDAEESLSRMEGKGNGKETVSDESLKNAILEALNKKNLSLREFLGIKAGDFKGMDDNQLLTKLISGYSAGVANGSRKNLSSLLLNYREVAEDEKTAAFSRLKLTTAGLKERQEETRSRYFKARANYDEYFDSLEIPAAGQIDGYQASDNKEEILYSELVKSAKKAYENSAYTDRTHDMRMLETSAGLADELDSSKYESLKVSKRKALVQIKNEILALNTGRYERYAEIKEHEWNLMWENLKFRKTQWQDSIKTIMRKGNSEWSRSVRKFEGSRRDWVKRFRQEYTDKKDLWNKKYGNFLNAKNQWINDTAIKAAFAGNKNILDTIGLSADGGATQTETAIGDMENMGNIGDLAIEIPKAENIIKGLTGGRLAKLLNDARYSNNLIAGTNTITDGILSLSSSGENSIANLVEKFQSEDKKEIEKQILYITAAKALKSIKKAAKNMEENIDSANGGVKKSLDNTFTGAGYKRAGDAYTKDILTDSTVLNGDQWEHKEIESYKYFILPSGLSLNPEKIADAGSLKNMSAMEIQTVIDRAMNTMKQVMEKIFGKADTPKQYTTRYGNDNYSKTKKNGSGFWFIRWDKEITGVKRTTRKVEIKQGLFYNHVGEAPVLKTGPNYEYAVSDELMKKNIQFTGSGEMGRIMFEFYRYSLLEN